MNKKYLEELYRIKFDLQAKIEKCKEDLKSPAFGCIACDHNSHASIEADKKAYECAEKYNDAAINFYFTACS
jgi:hypothetical protein